MALSNHDQAQIREYLLGKLNEAEQEKIEERLMVENELFDELEASKDELVEEYCAGELDNRERRWFEEHFLASPEGRQRHAFALAMDCLQQTRVPVQPEPLVRVQPEPTFLQRLRDFLRTHPLWLVTATAAVLLIATASLMLLRPGVPPHSLALTLHTTATERAPGEPQYPKVRLTPDVSELRISLQLNPYARAQTTYLAELDDRVNRRAIKPVAQDEDSVTVVIPASELHPGLYSLTLSAVEAQGETRRVPGNYIFEITK
jgi:AcrR family transcriptional regulator